MFVSFNIYRWLGVSHALIQHWIVHSTFWANTLDGILDILSLYHFYWRCSVWLGECPSKFDEAFVCALQKDIIQCAVIISDINSWNIKSIRNTYSRPYAAKAKPNEPLLKATSKSIILIVSMLAESPDRVSWINHNKRIIEIGFCCWQRIEKQ